MLGVRLSKALRVLPWPSLRLWDILLKAALAVSIFLGINMSVSPVFKLINATGRGDIRLSSVQSWDPCPSCLCMAVFKSGL